MLRYSRILGVRHSVYVEVALSHMPLRGRATCQPHIRATPLVGGRIALSTRPGPTLTGVKFRGTRSGCPRIGVHSRDHRDPRDAAPTDPILSARVVRPRAGIAGAQRRDVRAEDQERETASRTTPASGTARRWRTQRKSSWSFARAPAPGHNFEKGTLDRATSGVLFISCTSEDDSFT